MLFQRRQRCECGTFNGSVLNKHQYRYLADKHTRFIHGLLNITSPAPISSGY